MTMLLPLQDRPAPEPTKPVIVWPAIRWHSAVYELVLTVESEEPLALELQLYAGAAMWAPVAAFQGGGGVARFVVEPIFGRCWTMGRVLWWCSAPFSFGLEVRSL